MAVIQGMQASTVDCDPESIECPDALFLIPPPTRLRREIHAVARLLPV